MLEGAVNQSWHTQRVCGEAATHPWAPPELLTSSRCKHLVGPWTCCPRLHHSRLVSAAPPRSRVLAFFTLSSLDSLLSSYHQRPLLVYLFSVIPSSHACVHAWVRRGSRGEYEGEAGGFPPQHCRMFGILWGFLDICLSRNPFQSLLIYCLGIMWEAEFPKVACSLLVCSLGSSQEVVSSVGDPQTALKFLWWYCFWGPSRGDGAADPFLFIQGDGALFSFWVDG